MGELAKEEGFDYRVVDELTFSLLLDLEPYPYQLEFLEDNSERTIFVAGRQVGKTTITSVKALHFAITKANTTTLVLAPTWRQSTIIFSKMREMLMRQPLLMLEIARMTQTMIVFKNGSTIFCLPSGHTGETIRGFTAHLIIVDEGAYVPEDVYVAIEPSLATTQGRLVLLGTPAGKIGRFWEAFQDKNFSTHQVTSYESPLITKEWIDAKKEAYTDVQFRQEFLGEFAEELDVFYPHTLVKEQMADCWEDKPTEGEYYLGVDLARFGGDESAYVITKRINQYITMVYYETTSKKPLTDAIGRIQALNDKWKFTQIFIDETGLGGGVVDSVREKVSNAQGMTFTSDKREKIYTDLKYNLEKGLITLLNDKKLLQQMTSLTYKYTLEGAGKLKIIKDPRGHDDLVDALALSCKAEEDKFTILEGGDEAGIF
jgi:hypothetical protein